MLAEEGRQLSRVCSPSLLSVEKGAQVIHQPTISALLLRCYPESLIAWRAPPGSLGSCRVLGCQAVCVCVESRYVCVSINHGYSVVMPFQKLRYIGVRASAFLPPPALRHTWRSSRRPGKTSPLSLLYRYRSRSRPASDDALAQHLVQSAVDRSRIRRKELAARGQEVAACAAKCRQLPHSLFGNQTDCCAQVCQCQHNK